MGVGALVGWGEEEAGVFEEGVEEGEILGGEAFKLVAGGEGKAEPEAFSAGTGEEGAAGEALGVFVVAAVEVADEADELDLVEGELEAAAVEVEEIEGEAWGGGRFLGGGLAGTDETSGCEVARQEVAGEVADDDLFAG